MTRNFPIISMLAMIVISLALTDTTEASRVRPVYQPDLEIPCTMSLSKIKSAVRRGLTYRYWSATSKGGNRIVGTIYVRRHMLSVNITYNKRGVKVRYKTSENLKYRKRDGTKYIHGRANVWIQNFVIEIRRNLANSC